MARKKTTPEPEPRIAVLRRSSTDRWELDLARVNVDAIERIVMALIPLTEVSRRRVLAAVAAVLADPPLAVAIIDAPTKR